MIAGLELLRISGLAGYQMYGSGPGRVCSGFGDISWELRGFEWITYLLGSKKSWISGFSVHMQEHRF